LSASLYDNNDLKKLEFATHLQARKPEKSQLDSKQECMEGKDRTRREEEARCMYSGFLAYFTEVFDLCSTS
jgi:hypothetical protein